MKIKIIKGIFLLTSLLLMICATVYAATVATPEAPTVVVSNLSRRTADTGTTFKAMAGNITIMDLNAKTVTSAWAGFAGNITGTITLDDSAGKTMYDWAQANPRGEVFATQGAATQWTNLECYNFTDVPAAGSTPSIHYLLFNYSTCSGANTVLESVSSQSPCTSTGIVFDDVDGIDETFRLVYGYNSTGADARRWKDPAGAATQDARNFSVANVTIDYIGKCPMAQTYIADAVQLDTRSGNFTEVLLLDDDGSYESYESGEKSISDLVFATIIQRDSTSFDNKTYDYQMLLLENGHNADTATTTYYFFVELG